MFGLPLDDAQREIFASVAGDRAPPVQRVRGVLGHRRPPFGQSRIAAALAVYIAAFHRHKLAPASWATSSCCPHRAPNRLAVFNYAVSFLEDSPVLRQQIESVTTEEIRLTGNVAISVHAANYRSIRGRTLLGVIADESAYWRDETSAQPDVEIYRACAPALAAANGLWIGISSPYSQRGLLFQKHRDHFGKNGDTLVVQAATRVFNPTIPEAVIAAGAG